MGFVRWNFVGHEGTKRLGHGGSALPPKRRDLGEFRSKRSVCERSCMVSCKRHWLRLECISCLRMLYRKQAIYMQMLMLQNSVHERVEVSEGVFWTGRRFVPMQ